MSAPIAQYPPIGALVHVVSSARLEDPWEQVGWFLGAHLDEEDGAIIYGVLPLDERGTENAWQGHVMVELSSARLTAALLAGIELRPDDGFHAFAATYT